MYAINAPTNCAYFRMINIGVKFHYEDADASYPMIIQKVKIQMESDRYSNLTVMELADNEWYRLQHAD